MENGKFQFRLQFAFFESASIIGKQMVKYLVLEIIFDFRCKFSVYVKKKCKFLLILSSPSIHMKLSRTHLICCHCTEPRIINSSVLSLQLACCLKIQVKTRSTRTKSNHINDRQVYSRRQTMVEHKLNSVPFQARLLKTNRGRLYGLISKIYSQTVKLWRTKANQLDFILRIFVKISKLPH